MTLPSEIEVLADVVGRLRRLGLEYMLTGSLATSVYAEPRMTRDIDLVVAMAAEDAAGIRNAFSGDYYVPPELEIIIDGSGFFNLIHLDTVTKVDIVVRKDTPYRVHEFDRRRPLTVAGLDLWVVSKEDLMLSKLAWASDSRSEVQLRDVRSLAATGFDVDYIEHWVEELGLERVWREVRNA